MYIARPFVFPFYKYGPDLMVNKFNVSETWAGVIPSLVPFGTILGLKTIPKSDDEVDAIACAIAGSSRISTDKKLGLYN